MRRREFVIGGLTAAACPISARAQQPVIRRIGVLTLAIETDPYVQQRFDAFRHGLENRGWVEGRNIRIDYRFTTVERLQGLAKELVKSAPDAILADTTPVTAALQRETREIPLIFLEVSDPIGSGFIASLARPDGNLTGLLLFEEGISSKWLTMLADSDEVARV